MPTLNCSKIFRWLRIIPKFWILQKGFHEPHIDNKGAGGSWLKTKRSFKVGQGGSNQNLCGK